MKIQDNSVQVQAMFIGKVIGEAGCARRSVGFAGDIFWRAPTAVFSDKRADKFADGFDIFFPAPKVLRLIAADSAGEAGSDGIDHDEIGPVQEREFVVDELRGWRKRRTVFVKRDAPRSKLTLFEAANPKYGKVG